MLMIGQLKYREKRAIATVFSKNTLWFFHFYREHIDKQEGLKRAVCTVLTGAHKLPSFVSDISLLAPLQKQTLGTKHVLTSILKALETVQFSRTYMKEGGINCLWFVFYLTENHRPESTG